MGDQPPVSVVNAKRGADDGMTVLHERWCRRARKGHDGSSCDVIDISAPSVRVVFVHGMCNVVNLTPEWAVEPKDMSAGRSTCLMGLKRFSLGISSSPKRQQHQKAIQAIAHTDASKELDRSSPARREYMCSMVTGGLFALFEDMGTSFLTPFLIWANISLPCQSAPLTMCQKCKPAVRGLTLRTLRLRYPPPPLPPYIFLYLIIVSLSFHSSYLFPPSGRILRRTLRAPSVKPYHIHVFILRFIFNYRTISIYIISRTFYSLP